MHAIAGFVSFGRPPAPDVLDTLGASLSRLPDVRVETWTDGVAGLAALAYRSQTPALADDGRGSACVLDGTLANRDDLASTLGLPRDTPPARLVLAAYERWGTDLGPHLDGAIAAAVWDAPRRRLVAVRDRFGVRPFFTATHDPGALFATTAAALLAVGVPDDPDPWGVAERITETYLDPTVTFFGAVRRLPPGDVLEVRDGRASHRSYWRPDPSAPLLGDTPALADDLRERFDAAVRARVPPGQALGAELSGGLDSSSIVGTLLALRPTTPLHTFSVLFPGVAASDERVYQEAFYDHPMVVPVRMETNAESPLATGHAEALGIAGPLSLPMWLMEAALLRAVRREGIDVMMSGSGGDHLFATPSFLVVADALAHGRWGAARREVAAAAAAGESARGTWRAALREVARWVTPERIRRARIVTSRSLLHPDLARATRFDERVRDLLPLPRSARAHHADALYDLTTHDGLETVAAIAHGFGVRTEMPYWSADLVAFALRLPRRHLRRGGQSRPLLRKAMGDRLPSIIRNRQTKAFFDPILNDALRGQAWAEIEAMGEHPGALADWMDLTALRATVEALRRAPASHTSALDSRTLLRVHALWHWARRA